MQSLFNKNKNSLLEYFLFTREKAKEVEKLNLPLKLCHTDLHHWNIMQSNHSLMLLDWEGIKLAPVEADWYSILEQNYASVFLGEYLKYHKTFKWNEEAVEFYKRRRILEDIGEFVLQLLYEPLNEKERKSCLHELKTTFQKIEDTVRGKC